MPCFCQGLRSRKRFGSGLPKKKDFEITHLVNDLPTLKINDQSPGIFINGMGMGVDSHVCEKQIENAKTGIRQSYYAIALKVFKNLNRIRWI